MLDIVAIFLVITAMLAYVNHRFLRLPTTIGVMVTALGFSLALVGLDALGIAHGLREAEESLVRSVDFGEVLLQGMLSLLLFAGACMSTSGNKGVSATTIALSVLSTVASTAIVGVAMWLLLPLLGISLPLPYCVLLAR